MSSSSYKLSHVFSQSFQLYKTGLVQAFLIVFSITAFNQFLSITLANSLLLQDESISIASIGPTILSTACIVTTLLISAMLVQICLAAKLNGTHCSIPLAFRLSLHTFFPAFTAYLLFLALLTLGAFFYFIPSAICAVLFSLYLPALLFERFKPLDAFMRSYRLVMSQPLSSIVVVFIRAVVMYVPSAALALNLTFSGPTLTQILMRGSVALITALTVPYGQALLLSHFFALKHATEAQSE